MSKTAKTETKNEPEFKSKIGGQALIEGVMMRGVDTEAMAVRLPNGEIEVEQWELKPAKWYRKVPFIRGCVNMVVSFVDGYKCLSKSADKSMEGIEEEEPSKFEKWLTDKFGDKLMNAVMVVATVLGVLLALLLFMYLPALATKGLSLLIPALAEMSFVKNLIEGIIKIAIFVAYLWATSLLSDMRRTYEYHGAEHKTIFCYEHGLDLTVENVKKQKRFHPRCGTSFTFLVLFISIFVFSVFQVSWDSLLLRVGIKILLLPIIVAIAYELIRLAGKYDNIFTKIISAPGLWIQRLTTKEPDDSQIEVAIAAFKPCIPEDRERDRW
ncbi:MAG: DUF1385 domain-containing protein [Oscillospiraceae bacterium]|nr:DUF1385 domain-containing protein [Oscillospiraceae bacterium]